VCRPAIPYEYGRAGLVVAAVSIPSLLALAVRPGDPVAAAGLGLLILAGVAALLLAGPLRGSVRSLQRMRFDGSGEPG
jgi:hypothetical protein